MRLIFLNRFYAPELAATGQILTDVAEMLTAEGHEVMVITSHPGGQTVAAEETRAGVRIRRLRTRRAANTGAVGKGLDWIAFQIAALRRLRREMTAESVIVAMTDPPLLGIGAAILAGPRRARVVQWVQDVYPEVAMELTGQHWLRIVRPSRNWAWRRAARCIALGDDMAGVMRRARVQPDRIAVIPNPAPSELRFEGESTGLRRAWGLTRQFVVQYSGNLGRVHDLEPVLEVARRLADTPEIVFVFVGGGPQRAEIEARANRRGLRNVQFHPAQPRDQLANSLAVADVHLVTLKPGCEHYVLPSKLYGIAAVGRPILYIGPTDCEVARIVTAGGLGLAFDRGAAPEVAATLRSLAADRVRLGAFRDAALGFAGTQAERTWRGWRELMAGLELAASPPLRIPSSP